MKSLSKMLLAVVLSCSLVVAGCSLAQFDSVLNEVGPAVGDVLSILSAFGVDPAPNIQAKVDSDVAALEKLYSDFESAKSASDAAGIQTDLNAAFSTLNSDLSTVFSAAQVSNPNTQKELTVIVGSVGALVSIAEAIVAPAVSTETLRHAAHVTSLPSASDAVSEFNSALTGAQHSDARLAGLKLHKIHNHSFFVRVVTLGHAK